MVAFARESEVNNGAHSVNPLSRKRRGNAERWIEANSFCRVETHGLAEMRKHRSRPQDPDRHGAKRITRPASRIASAIRDEGIVQPFSKEREKLSRRLHQKCAFSGEIRRARSLFDA
jgi:hypothetical protein